MKKERNPLAYAVGMMFLVAAIWGVVSGMRYEPPESPSPFREPTVVVRHEFHDAVCFTVTWNVSFGRSRQIRLECVPK